MTEPRTRHPALVVGLAVAAIGVLVIGGRPRRRRWSTPPGSSRRSTTCGARDEVPAGRRGPGGARWRPGREPV